LGDTNIGYNIRCERLLCIVALHESQEILIMKRRSKIIFVILVLPFIISYADSPSYAFAQTAIQANTLGPKTCVYSNSEGPPISPDPTTGLCPNGSTTYVNVNLTYIPLEPLTGFVNYQNGQTNFCSLLNGLFRLIIFLGGLLAVGSFVYAGVLYMTSEVTGTKSKAKDSLQASVWGLCLLLASYIILNTINPQLISCNQALNPVSSYQPVTPSTSPAPANCTNGVGTGCLTPDQQAAISSVQQQQLGGAAASQAGINTALQTQQQQQAQCVTNGGTIIPPGGLSINSCRGMGYTTCSLIAGPTGYRCGI
jgi:hypothetical protein